MSKLNKVHGHPAWCAGPQDGIVCGGMHLGRAKAITATADVEDDGDVSPLCIVHPVSAYTSRQVLLTVDRGDRSLHADLAPKEARKLAVALLRAAEVAESK